MKKKTKILMIVAIVAIIVVGAILVFVFSGKQDSAKFIGKWKIESAMGGIPYGATAYYNFYENGTVKQEIIYQDGEENITWNNYSIKDKYLYIEGLGGSSSLPLGLNYEFSNGDTHLKLTVQGYLFAEMTKV